MAIPEVADPDLGGDFPWMQGLRRSAGQAGAVVEAEPLSAEEAARAAGAARRYWE